MTSQPRWGKESSRLHLAAVGRVVDQRPILIAAVDRLPDPHALVAATVGEAQAAQLGPVDEVGDGDFDRQGVGIEAGRHRAEYTARRSLEGAFRDSVSLIG